MLTQYRHDIVNIAMSTISKKHRELDIPRHSEQIVWKTVWIWEKELRRLKKFKMADIVIDAELVLLLDMWQYTFIAQFGGRHEDLFNPDNSCRPRAKPEGDMNFLGWTNLHVSRLTGQLIFYYTESWMSTFYRGNMHWIEVLHTFAFHSK